jgi:hypothetical protein
MSTTNLCYDLTFIHQLSLITAIKDKQLNNKTKNIINKDKLSKKAETNIKIKQKENIIIK